MNYEIEIIEPRAKRILEELANLNLIKFIQPKNKIQKVTKKTTEEPLPTREEIKAGLIESAQDVAAALRGEIKLKSAWAVLDELEAEQKSLAL